VFWFAQLVMKSFHSPWIHPFLAKTGFGVAHPCHAREKMSNQVLFICHLWWWFGDCAWACSTPIHMPELDWLKHPFGLVKTSFCHSLTGQNGTVHCELTPQWMMCFEGHGFDTQRSQSPQSEPSSCHAMAGEVHWHHTKSAQGSIRNECACRATLTVENTWSGQPVWRLTHARLRHTPTSHNKVTVILRWISAVHIEFPLNFTRSTTRNCAQLQCDLMVWHHRSCLHAGDDFQACVDHVLLPLCLSQSCTSCQSPFSSHQLQEGAERIRHKRQCCQSPPTVLIMSLPFCRNPPLKQCNEQNSHQCDNHEMSTDVRHFHHWKTGQSRFQVPKTAIFLTNGKVWLDISQWFAFVIRACRNVGLKNVVTRSCNKHILVIPCMQLMCASWLVECCEWEHQREKNAHRVAVNVSVTAVSGALSIFLKICVSSTNNPPQVSQQSFGLQAPKQSLLDQNWPCGQVLDSDVNWNIHFSSWLLVLVVGTAANQSDRTQQNWSCQNGLFGVILASWTPLRGHFRRMECSL